MTDMTQEDRNRSAGEQLAAARKKATLAAEEFVASVRAVLEDPAWSSPISSAIELERVGKLSHKGAWQVYRIGYAADPLAELSNMPGNTTLGQLRRAAERQGLGKSGLVRLTTSHAALDRLMKTIGGDRDTFIEMVAEWRGMAVSGAAAAHCRQAFRANRHVWGISAKASFGGLWLIDSGSAVEAIRIRGMHGLTASRRSVWDVYGSHDPDSTTSSAMGDAGSEVSPLLPEHCRGVLPRLERQHNGEWTNIRAHFEATGQIAHHSLVFAERITVGDPAGLDWFNLACSFPTEWLQVDMIAPIHWGPRLANHGLFTVQAAQMPDPEPQRIHAAPTEASADVSLRTACGSSAMGDYPSMLASIGLKEGLDLSQYTLFRATCQYPPTGSALRMDIGFSDRP